MRPSRLHDCAHRFVCSRLVRRAAHAHDHGRLLLVLLLGRNCANASFHCVGGAAPSDPGNGISWTKGAPNGANNDNIGLTRHRAACAAERNCLTGAMKISSQPGRNACIWASPSRGRRLLNSSPVCAIFRAFLAGEKFEVAFYGLSLLAREERCDAAAVLSAVGAPAGSRQCSCGRRRCLTRRRTARRPWPSGRRSERGCPEDAPDRWPPKERRRRQRRRPWRRRETRRSRSATRTSRPATGRAGTARLVRPKRLARRRDLAGDGSGIVGRATQDAIDASVKVQADRAEAAAQAERDLADAARPPRRRAALANPGAVAAAPSPEADAAAAQAVRDLEDAAKRSADAAQAARNPGVVAAAPDAAAPLPRSCPQTLRRLIALFLPPSRLPQPWGDKRKRVQAQGWTGLRASAPTDPRRPGRPSHPSRRPGRGSRAQRREDRLGVGAARASGDEARPEPRLPEHPAGHPRHVVRHQVRCERGLPTRHVQVWRGRTGAGRRESGGSQGVGGRREQAARGRGAED